MKPYCIEGENSANTTILLEVFKITFKDVSTEDYNILNYSNILWTRFLIISKQIY